MKELFRLSLLLPECLLHLGKMVHQRLKEDLCRSLPLEHWSCVTVLSQPPRPLFSQAGHVCALAKSQV